MREDEVYVGTKAWFRKNGFIPLAGQPPNGCDNIPTIEIKEHSHRNKGSKGSFKPDLVVANQSFIVLVECKPTDDKQDEKKLLEVLQNEGRLRLLFDELTQRGILKRRKLDASFPTVETLRLKLRLCLSHGGRPRLMERVTTLCLQSPDGTGYTVQPIDQTFSIRI